MACEHRLIANYFFSSLCNDAIHVSKGSAQLTLSMGFIVIPRGVDFAKIALAYDTASIGCSVHTTGGLA